MLDILDELKRENRKLREGNVVLQGINEELADQNERLRAEQNYWPSASTVLAGAITAMVLGLAFYAAIFLAIWIGTALGVGQ